MMITPPELLLKEEPLTEIPFYDGPLYVPEPYVFPQELEAPKEESIVDVKPAIDEEKMELERDFYGHSLYLMNHLPFWMFVPLDVWRKKRFRKQLMELRHSYSFE